jgi:hypothetical protein
MEAARTLPHCTMLVLTMPICPYAHVHAAANGMQPCNPGLPPSSLDPLPAHMISKEGHGGPS